MSISPDYTYKDIHYKVKTQDEVDGISGKKTVELITENGESFLLYEVIADNTAEDLTGSVKRVASRLLSALRLSQSSSPISHYAVKLSPAKTAILTGELDLTTLRWTATPVDDLPMSLFDKSAQLDDTIDFYDAIEQLGEKIVDQIKERQQEIHQRKEAARSLVQDSMSDPRMTILVSALNNPHSLRPIGSGQSGAFFLFNQAGEIVAVVKPADQEAFNLNNCFGFTNPFKECASLRLRATIPNNLAAHQECLGYEIAYLAGLEHVVPKTMMAIIQNNNFPVFADMLAQDGQREAVVADLRFPGEREKLVSVQEFVKGTSLQERCIEASRKEETLVVDQQALEDVGLFLWLSGDQDANIGNFLIYELPNGKLGIKKIDNGAICGEEKQKGFVNYLSSVFSKQQDQPISKRGIKKINSVPIEEIADVMRKFGRSEAAIYAFEGRIKGIQQYLSEHPNATLLQIDQYVEKHNAGIYA